MVVFISFTFIPSIMALSSPSNSISKDFDIKKLIIITIAKTINGSNNTSHFAPPKLPTVQNSALLAWFEFSAEYISKLVNAENIVDIAIPVRTSLVVDVVFPICVPIPNTKTPDNIDPTNAPLVMLFIPILEAPPKTITATAPQDAPDEIPSI